jgi:TetR/AcrR family transcriptional regulator, transcriptional repressor of bet genes
MPLTPIGELRRRELLTAAFQVILRDGLASATTSSIAAHAGASKGMVHFYFPSKRLLILAALRVGHAHRTRELARKLRVARTPQDRVAAFIDVNLGAQHLNREHCGLWIALAAEALNDPEFARLLNVLRRRERSNLLHALRQLLPEIEALKLLLTLRAVIEACRLWVGYIGWYDSAHATVLAHSVLRSSIPHFASAERS